jgi:DNA-binding transcriptional LysR family regulator
MDLRQLEVFLEVKEQLHFGRAAERLFLAQPTVSETIRRLERELGGRLFERSTRSVRLTPLGEAFAPSARAAYDAVVTAYESGRAFARDEASRFAVGHTGDEPHLVEVVVELQREHPGVLVSLQARSTARLMEELAGRRLHVVLGWDPVIDDDTDTLELGTCPLSLVLPADHPLARRDHLTLADIAAEPLIGWPRASNPLAYDRFAAAMDATGAPWTLVGTALGADDLVARVLSGFGVGLAYGSGTDAAAFPGAVCLPVDEPELRFTRTLAWRRDETHPALVPFVESIRRTHAPADPTSTSASPKRPS